MANLSEIKKWQDEVLRNILGSSKWDYITTKRYPQVERARTLTSRLQESYPALEFLGNSAYKTLFCSEIDDSFEKITFGGPCCIFTGDLKYLKEGMLPGGKEICSVDDIARWLNDYYPRLDQIHDSVGITESDRYICIVEDCLFAERIAKWLNRPSWKLEIANVIRQHHKENTKYHMLSWTELVSGKKPVIDTIYLSDIESELWQLVEDFGKLLGIQNLKEKFILAPVSVTYTHLWKDLLRRKGYLNEQVIFCSEPFFHFDLSKEEIKYTYKYFKDNPYGEEGYCKSFSVAGIIPAWYDSKKTRDLSCNEVINKSSDLGKMLDTDPLPLNKNEVVCNAINYLFWDRDSRSIIYDILSVYREYKAKAASDERGKAKIQANEKLRPKVEKLWNKLEELVGMVYGKCQIIKQN